MLSRFDDYPIHQTPEPIAHSASSDQNFYDRYFFNGYSKDGQLFFAMALGVYPNRRVMDAAFNVVVDGRQHVVRASRLAPRERSETRVGPISLSIEDPMRHLRWQVAPNDFEIRADLDFHARSAAVEEPRFVHHIGHQVMMDVTRITQFGRWEGSIQIGSDRFEVDVDSILGCRDRSWGIRPIGERHEAAPGAPPQFFWLWAPLHFDEFCTHFDVNEDAEGRRWHWNGNRIGLIADADADPLDPELVESMRSVSHEIRWEPGTRRAASATITLEPHHGEAHRIELEPLLTFQMLGLGYLHPEWGHGMWKGSLAVDGESWRLKDLDPMDPRHLHVQQLCRARLGDQDGVGVFEQLVIGPHRPTGLTSILDPAA
ncbi:MAG: hypothetical protein V3T33_05815 [Myxococcota bacterium]